MPLSRTLVDNLGEQDLRDLITAGVPEGRRIEYKRELPGTNDEAKREFLADVTSFANASGGDLIYGIDEDGGVPRALVPLAGDADAEILRLESIIRAGAEPRLPNVQTRAVPLASGGFVLVIRVPQSWLLPHMVIFKNSSRFFSRTSAGKYQLDVSELRSLFSGSANAADQVRRFRDERLARIVAGEGPLPMQGSALTLLHLVPLRVADPAFRLDVRELHTHTRSLSPLYASGWSHRYNLDGFVTWSPAGPASASYVQVFRHGAIEAVDSGMLDVGTAPIIPGSLLAEELRTNIPKYLNVQRQLGVDLPIVVLLTLIRVRGYRLAIDRTWVHQGSPVERDLVMTSEVLVDDWGADIATVLRPALDALWNAAGYAECSLYDRSGAWVGD